ncbi:MAG: hypothetical protein U0840_25060 [Gemmataceae bacterium]
MILAYTALLVLLACVHALLRWRVGRLERHYARVAGAAEQLLQRMNTRPGNNQRHDPLVSARIQYDLAQAALSRERAERRYVAWQAFSERFGYFSKKLAGFRGKMVPYATGVLDIGGLLVLMERFGVTLDQVKTWVGIGS